MLIRIPKSELNQALSYAQRIAESKTTMPILENVLFSADSNGLRILASDLEVTVCSTVKTAEIVEEGCVTVKAKTISDIVRELPEGIITVSSNEAARVQIKTDSSTVNVIGISADEYPELSGIGLTGVHNIKSPVLLEMINKTMYAVSTDETRFNLNGVCFYIDEDEKEEKFLKLIATDGHRLSLISRPAGDVFFAGQILVPKKGLNEIKKLLESQGDSDTSMNVVDNFLILNSENIKLAIRLIDGEFPDCKKVIPEETASLAVVKSGILLQALKRVALMTSEKGKGVGFSFSKDKLVISSSSPELGDATEEVEVSYNGDDIKVGYNVKYVSDIASSLREDQNLCIDIHGSSGPARFFPEGDESYIGVVMPVRLS